MEIERERTDEWTLLTREELHFVLFWFSSSRSWVLGFFGSLVLWFFPLPCFRRRVGGVPLPSRVGG